MLIMDGGADDDLGSARSSSNNDTANQDHAKSRRAFQGQVQRDKDGDFRSNDVRVVVRQLVSYFKRHQLSCFWVTYKMQYPDRQIHGLCYIVEPARVVHKQHLGVIIHYPIWLPVYWPNPRRTFNACIINGFCW